ncbi:MAG: thiosulfate oxidation carrier complex protein SoxZ [Bauldia sp.]|nr:thiosulfate oxidation carrier complex protein SoxZ [Bauldia sp.]
MAGSTITRRTALGFLGATMTMPLALRPAAAQAAWWRAIPGAAALVGDAAPATDGIRIDLPLVSEDGSAVDLGLTVDRPMTQDSFVAELHVFADRNPSPEVAAFFFSPLSGRAAIATRIRLNESQTVGVVARMNTGEVIVGSRDVVVTVSGCLARVGGTAPGLMETRVRAPTRFVAGAPGEVTTLINHPMETGLRTTLAGEILPENIVRRFLAAFDRATVFEARFHRSVATNPYLRFFVAPPRPGELALRWEADGGLVADARVDLAVGA